jgi:hypothetical protein
MLYPAFISSYVLTLLFVINFNIANVSEFRVAIYFEEQQGKVLVP